MGSDYQRNGWLITLDLIDVRQERVDTVLRREGVGIKEFQRTHAEVGAMVDDVNRGGLRRERTLRALGVHHRGEEWNPQGDEGNGG